MSYKRLSFFFFQAEDGIRDESVTGVQTCALPIWARRRCSTEWLRPTATGRRSTSSRGSWEIGRASCRGRGEISVGGVSLKKKKKKWDQSGGREPVDNRQQRVKNHETQ